MMAPYGRDGSGAAEDAQGKCNAGRSRWKSVVEKRGRDARGVCLVDLLHDGSIAVIGKFQPVLTIGGAGAGLKRQLPCGVQGGRTLLMVPLQDMESLGTALAIHADSQDDFRICQCLGADCDPRAWRLQVQRGLVMRHGVWEMERREGGSIGGRRGRVGNGWRQFSGGSGEMNSR